MRRSEQMERPTYNLRVFYYHGDEGDWSFSFREVWYDERGEIARVARAHFSPFGESAGDLEEQVLLMRQALKLPRLSTDLLAGVELV
jgi:hypothetical protein